MIWSYNWFERRSYHLEKIKNKCVYGQFRQLINLRDKLHVAKINKNLSHGKVSLVVVEIKEWEWVACKEFHRV